MGGLNETGKPRRSDFLLVQQFFTNLVPNPGYAGGPGTVCGEVDITIIVPSGDAVHPISDNILPVVAVGGLTVTLSDQSYDPDVDDCGHSGSGRALIDRGPGSFVSYDFVPPLNDQPSGQEFSHTYGSAGTYYIQYAIYDNVISYPVFLETFSVTVP